MLAKREVLSDSLSSRSSCSSEMRKHCKYYPSFISSLKLPSPKTASISSRATPMVSGYTTKDQIREPRAMQKKKRTEIYYECKTALRLTEDVLRITFLT